jgi:hypothetical protein
LAGWGGGRGRESPVPAKSSEWETPSPSHHSDMWTYGGGVSRGVGEGGKEGGGTWAADGARGGQGLEVGWNGGRGGGHFGCHLPPSVRLPLVAIRSFQAVKENWTAVTFLNHTASRPRAAEADDQGHPVFFFSRPGLQEKSTCRSRPIVRKHGRRCSPFVPVRASPSFPLIPLASGPHARL